MQQDGILGRQQWQYATPFHVFSYIDIQDIFVPKKVLEWIWVYYVNDISMVPEKRSKFSCFPENHWLVSFIVYAFDKTTFFQLGVNKAEQKLLIRPLEQKATKKPLLASVIYTRVNTLAKPR